MKEGATSQLERAERPARIDGEMSQSTRWGNEEDDEWKTGENTGRAIMPKWSDPKWSDPDKPETPSIPDPDHQYYSISLQDQFEGLQIIVRISAIELTPEKPLYGG